MQARFGRRSGLAKARAAPRAVSVRPAVLIATSTIPLLAVTFLVPAPVVMPGIAAASIMSAAFAALTAWSFGQERDSDMLTMWDVAGAFALIACSAGIFSDPARLVETLASTVR